MTKVKICGLSNPETITAAIESEADFIGFVFYPPSPRHIEIEVAKYLSAQIPDEVKIVGLFVNPNDQTLQEVLNDVPLSMIQLHGNENPARVAEIKETFELPVMKALSVETAADLEKANDYNDVADWLLFDAKPLTSTQAGKNIKVELPGGNGKTFDWTILKNYKGTKPWMLAGGLNPDNISEALDNINPNALDVSSGVESASGVKDIDKIRSFLRNAKLA